MKKMVLGFVAAVALVGCGTSPLQQCKDGTTTICKKVFECYTTDAEKMAIMSVFGADAAACATKLQASCTDTGGCTAPKTYDSSAASACISAYGSLACTDLKAGKTPDSCNNTCK